MGCDACCQVSPCRCTTPRPCSRWACLPPPAAARWAWAGAAARWAARMPRRSSPASLLNMHSLGGVLAFTPPAGIAQLYMHLNAISSIGSACMHGGGSVTRPADQLMDTHSLPCAHACQNAVRQRAPTRHVQPILCESCIRSVMHLVGQAVSHSACQSVGRSATPGLHCAAAA